MKEIEVKILGVNVAQLKRRFKKLRAKKIFSGTLEATYFDLPGKILSKKKQILRLRKTEDKNILTFKKPLPGGKTKAAEETEFEVDNFLACQQVLQELGYKPFFSYTKKRDSYQVGNVHLEIDQYAGKFKKIPPFLEIEAHSEKELFAVLKKLGFSEKDAKPWHGGQVLKHYGFKVE